MSEISKTTVWQVPETLVKKSPLPTHVDTCVIGAGIAGLSVAYHLLRMGQKVAVIDRGDIGAGQTAATSAHLTNVLDERVSRIVSRRGAEVAKLATQSHAAAIDSIEEIALREGIQCDFRRVDGYLFSHNGLSDQLKEEFEACEKVGMDVQMLEQMPIGTLGGSACLKFGRQAQFQPLEYLEGLAQAIEKLGGKFVLNTPVKGVAGDGPHKVETNDGWIIEAQNVVVATNSPITNLFALQTKQAPYTTYIVGFRIPSSTIAEGLYWDTAEPFHYVRTVKGEDSDWLIVGGEDHKSGQEKDHELRFTRLERWGRERFGITGPVERRWSGQVMQTLDGLAHIGHNPGSAKSMYVVTGDCGNGLTHGALAGILISELIQHGKHAWQTVYSPSRMPIGGLGTFLSEGANVALQYTSWLTPGEVSSEDDVQPGTGAIVRSGFKKIAVYREEDGTLHKCSASCPHLGAIVQWNAVEQTWDCPAHGSKFDCEGHVLNGPANSDLKQMEVAETANNG